MRLKEQLRSQFTAELKALKTVKKETNVTVGRPHYKSRSNLIERKLRYSIRKQKAEEEEAGTQIDFGK